MKHPYGCLYAMADPDGCVENNYVCHSTSTSPTAGPTIPGSPVDNTISVKAYANVSPPPKEVNNNYNNNGCGVAKQYGTTSLPDFPDPPARGAAKIVAEMESSEESDGDDDDDDDNDDDDEDDDDDDGDSDEDSENKVESSYKYDEDYEDDSVVETDKESDEDYEFENKRATDKNKYPKRKVASKKQSAKSRSPKVRTKKRKIYDRPIKVGQIKDGVMRDQFDQTLFRMNLVQDLCTFKDENIRKKYPQVMPIIVTFDDLVEKPHKVHNGMNLRDERFASVFVPEGLTQKEVGKMFVKLGSEMKKKFGKDFLCTNNVEEYKISLFGESQRKGRRGR